MATPAQLTANRLNAQRSTGPRTDDGKTRARQNALRHGLCAGIPSMSDETEEEVQSLLDTLREEHQPVGATEEILVYKMAEHLWFGKRASYLLSEQLDWADKGEENSREIGLMMRYHAASDRGYYKALAELRKIQKERRTAEIGFVPQNDPAPAGSAPAPAPAPDEIGFVPQFPDAGPPTPAPVVPVTAQNKLPIAQTPPKKAA